MSRVEVIAEQIRNLSPEELTKFRDWFLEHEWAEWDRQIEQDSGNVRLDRIFAKARADHAAGKSKKL